MGGVDTDSEPKPANNLGQPIEASAQGSPSPFLSGGTNTENISQKKEGFKKKKGVHKKKQARKLQRYESQALATPSSVWRDDIKGNTKVGEVGFRVKPLVVIDLNGVLVERMGMGEAKGEEDCDGFGGGRGYKVMLTEGELEEIMEDFAVGVWSSGDKKSVRKILNGAYGRLVERLVFVWGGERCLGDKQVGKGEKNTRKKPMRRVHGEFAVWDESNCVLVDDSEEKVVEGDRRVIVGREDVKRLKEILGEEFGLAKRT
ncbi:hypothetical protein TrRE_jg12853 [Triparma retinervis]|uniref:FCP1 homology domain-containing protein n=1 Tax=Triparma retinervis TaxID=2557542 RepID=A0A9W7FAZ0_9STRA|nr:hypothetical protein TrRE_jg12853 [Triparma retinervis]